MKLMWKVNINQKKMTGSAARLARVVNSIKTICPNIELIHLRDILKNMLTYSIPWAHHLGLIDDVRGAVMAVKYDSSPIIEIKWKKP